MLQQITLKNLITLRLDICEIADRKSIFITGKNMSGKTELLLQIIKKLTKRYGSDSVHFIDTINRSILVCNNEIDSIDEIISELGSCKDLLSRRLRREYLNRVDVVKNGVHHKGGEYFSKYLIHSYRNSQFKKDINNYLSKFNIRMNIKKLEIEFYIGKVKAHPSSGLQALVRLYIEFYYAVNQNARFIVVDELDSHLDSSVCKNIYSILHNSFPTLTIISTIHSLMFFKEISNVHVFTIQDSNFKYKITDADDLYSLEQINKDLFNSNSPQKEKSIYERIYVKTVNKLKLTKEEIDLINSNGEISNKDRMLRNIILEYKNYE